VATHTRKASTTTHTTTIRSRKYRPDRQLDLTDICCSWEELYQCGKDQGIDIRPAAQGGDIKIGDMLFVRSGWKEAYDNKSDDDRTKAALRHGAGKDGEDGQRYAGVSQEQNVLDWLHDCYFSSVAGDAPAFEAWPTHEDYHLHEYILALWGMPLGEMLDLEKLAQTCREKNRWFFFFTSAPANCPGKLFIRYGIFAKLTNYCSWCQFPRQRNSHLLIIRYILMFQLLRHCNSLKI
jgi:hypothetical protein